MSQLNDSGQYLSEESDQERITVNPVPESSQKTILSLSFVGFTFLSFVLCPLCSRPSSCLKSSVDLGAVLQDGLWAWDYLDWATVMTMGHGPPITKATQGINVQLCLLGEKYKQGGCCAHLAVGTLWEGSRSTTPLSCRSFHRPNGKIGTIMKY